MATVVTMAASFWCMSQVLRMPPMGTAYAVWTGVGVAGALAWGILAKGKRAGAARTACVRLILAGVAGLRLG